MPYTQLLSRSFQIVRRQPALWILGIMLAFFGGGGGGGTNFYPQGQFDETFFESSPAEGLFSNLPEWFNPEKLFLVGLFFVCLLIGWLMIAFVIRSVALVGLIEGVNQAVDGLNLQWQAY